MSKEKIEIPKDPHPFPPFKQQITGAPPGLEEYMNPAPMYNADHYKGSEKLKDKVALITGGDSGIVRSVAVLFTREGADVAFTYTDTEREDAEKTLELIKAEEQKGIKILLEVSDYNDCRKSVQAVIDKFGQLDILVNNAAYQNHAEGFENLPLKQVIRTINVNLLGYIYMAKAALEHLKSGSVIINTSSVVASQGAGSLIDYAATKGAISNFCKTDIILKN